MYMYCVIHVLYAPHVYVTTREAALSSTDCTESEPEVVPGSGVVKEDRRPRMVPQVKPGHHIKLLVEILNLNGTVVYTSCILYS